MNSPVEDQRPHSLSAGASRGADGEEVRSTVDFDPASTRTLPGDANRASDETLPPRADAGAGAESAAASTSFPRQFGGYELLNELARGGMGIVYKARQISANRIVALKVIQRGELAGPEDKLRFQTEAEAAASLSHPHIVPIYDVGEVDGQNYFSMELVAGDNLRRRVADGPLSNREAARVVQLVAAAMAYAHSKGIIHRDLKPENVLIDAAEQPRITDFGLAKRLEADSNLTSTGQILGTPGYMSPEQAGGETAKIDTRSDVYSIGAVLYCVLAGRPPFQAPSVIDTLIQVIGREPVSPREINPFVDKDLETLCLKCLEKQPSQRPPTAEHLSEELGRYLRGEPIHSRPVGTVARVARWARRNRMVAGLASAVLVSLVVGVSVSSYFAVVATRRATEAEKGREIAVRTLHSVLFNVQRKLKSFPQTREVRRTIIQEALRDLDTVSNEIGSDDSVNYDTAVALAELGRLFDEIGIEGEQTAAATAEKYYGRALSLFEKLRSQDPHDLKLASEYAAALSEITDFYANLERPRDAVPLMQQELELRRQIVAADPANRGAQTMLCKTLIDIADAAFLMGDVHRARAILKDAIELRRTEDARGEPSDLERRQMGLALMRFGEACTESGDMPAARRALDSSLEINRALQSEAPEDTERTLSLSSTFERLGGYYAKLGDFAAARENYEQMREQMERALKIDPSNRMIVGDYPICFDKLYEVAEQSGDLKAVEQACVKSIELRRELLAADGSNQKYAAELREDEVRLESVRSRLRTGSK
ncbi:MAG: protein kinase [Planctomycetaceae bacterium]